MNHSRQANEQLDYNYTSKRAANNTPIRKNMSRKTIGFINRDLLITALALGTFAAVLAGKILVAPEEREGEQWLE